MLICTIEKAKHIPCVCINFEVFPGKNAIVNKGRFIHKNTFSSVLRNETVTSSYDSDCLKMDLFMGRRTINHSCRKSQLLTALDKFKIYW